MKKIISPIILALFLSVAIASSVFATIGVGVGAGKITLNEDLKPGSIYQLPAIPVMNTGDEESNYGMSVEFNQNQPEMRPDSSWFSYDDQTFHLSPGGSRLVKMSLAIPLKTVPGNYFAYLEAHPIKASVSGVSSIGVAAATKIYFTVAPSNIFQAIYYRTKSLVEGSAPWSYIVFAFVGLFIIVKIFKKFFKFNIAINVK
jgi:hypothetical protein